ncbi:MAG: C25 family cysteine peptidase, partial [Candidatus Thermoplasmatota archaeon]|nr:C25 family cysteine peptidase [Candidatus Thermoplasmatota archaeon]
SFGLSEAPWTLPQDAVDAGKLSEKCVNDSNAHVRIIKNKVNATVKLLSDNGMGIGAAEGSKDVLLALVGGCVAIPFYYYPFAQSFVNGEVNDNIPMDLMYGTTGDDEFVLGLSVGRLVSRDLSDSLEVVGREINYAKLIEQSYGSLSSVGAWKDTATVYAGNLLLESNWPIVFLTVQMELQNTGGFTAYGNYGPTANDPILSTQIESSNFVFFNVHGSPEGIVSAGAIEPTGAISQSGIRVAEYNLGPGVCFASSCLTSRIDDIDINASFALSWLHAGYVAYMGATRSSVGSTAPSYGPLDMGGSNAICAMTMMNMLNGNLPMGIAMKNAKNAYAEQYGATGTHEYTLKEFVLYGDPAFNPYEPCNNG